MCLEDHIALGEYLEERTHLFHVDHLGRYRGWIDKHGIPAETEWGWATAETFDEENIEAYIKEASDD